MKSIISIIAGIMVAEIMAAAPNFDNDGGKYNYTYPYYVVSVEAGAIATLSTNAQIIKYENAEAEGEQVDYANFQALTSGTFFKTGAGTLKIVEGIPNWGGQIHVMEGRLESLASLSLGKTCSTGVRASPNDGTYVHSGAVMYRKHPNGGATVENASNAGGTGDRKYIAIEGSGPDGLGADILDSPTANDATWPMGYDLALTDDALLRIVKNGTIMKMSWSPAPGSKLWLNGHTLTITGEYANAYSGFQQNGGWITPGHLVMKNAELRIYGNPTFEGDSSSTITFEDNSIWGFIGNFSGTYTPWSVIINSLRYLDAQSDATYQVNRHDWKGPVQLNCDVPLRCWLRNGEGESYITLSGKVSGRGGFTKHANQRNLRFELNNPENCFEGSVMIDRGTLSLGATGALPLKGPGATISNGTLLINREISDIQIPQVKFCGDCVIKAPENIVSSGSATKLVKEGEGVLDVQTGIGADELEVLGGSVKINPFYKNTYAGMIEGILPGSDSNAGASKEMESMTLVTNGVKLAMDNAHKDRVKFTCHMYYGYLWNNETTNVNWTFFTCVANSSLIRFDNERKRIINNYQGGKSPGLVTVKDVTPGPHWFEWRSYSSVGGDGRPCLYKELPVEYVWADGYSVAWDPMGRGSKDYHDYMRIEDPGDGSIITTTDDSAALLAGRFSMTPVYKKMKFARGTSLNLSGKDYTIEELAGCPTIVGKELAITDKWTIDAADVALGGKLVTNGKLTLKDGAVIEIVKNARTGNSPAEGWVVAEVEGGITLPEDWQSEMICPGDGGVYSLKLSADQKKLILRHEKGAVLIIK